MKKVLPVGAVDCHTHTQFSHDSVADPAGSVRMAKERGLLQIAFTDHCDVEFCADTDIGTPIVQSVAAAREQGALAGVEMGEGLWMLSAAKAVLDSADFDIVIGSVHAVRYPNLRMPYSRIDFSAFDDGLLCDYLRVYFADVLELAQTGDFDVLAHLTCPLKYICGVYGRRVSLAAYAETIDAIFDTIIARRIALEVNTSGVGTALGQLMPDVPLLRRYRERGGQLLTLGSDAHTPERVGVGFREAIAALGEIGFTQAYYYKKRAAVPYEMKG